jgi:hypothetical protein
MTNFMVSVWVALAWAPGYFDPQSHEALYEGDVSGWVLDFSFGQRPEGEEIKEHLARAHARARGSQL